MKFVRLQQVQVRVPERSLLDQVSRQTLEFDMPLGSGVQCQVVGEAVVVRSSRDDVVPWDDGMVDVRLNLTLWVDDSDLMDRS